MRKNKVFLCATLFFVVFALFLLVFGAIDSIAAASRTYSSLKTGTELAFNPSDSPSTMSPVSSVASSVDDSDSLVIDPTIGTDICPPQIVGAVDKEVVAEDSISYRTGVSVFDDSDEIVDLEIDSNGVDFPRDEDLRWDFRVTLYNTREEIQKEEPTASERDERGLLAFCAVPRSRQEIADHLGIASVQYAVRRYVEPLIDSGKLVMTIPDKPKSPKQKFAAKK